MTRIDWSPALAGSSSLAAVSAGAGLAGFGGGGIDRRFAEGAFEFVERNLARPQRPFQHLRRERSDRVLRRRRRGGRRDALDHALQIGNQIVVGAVGLALLALERFQNLLDAVDGGENERDGFAGRRHAVAKFAHQRLGGVRQRFQPRQPEEAAGALDGVDEAENVIENLGVVRILLETHEFDVDHVETLVGLGHEFPQQVVHEKRLHRRASARPPLSIGSAASVSVKRLILVAD